jgi:FMN reductase (NADPH)/FMN reductase [NAD(P)H]
MQMPKEADLFLASCDALIAAQTAVLAAESFGIGSCYIGDIMEQYEIHRDLLALPPYVFPITMVVFGFPTAQQMKRGYTSRFGEQYVLFHNQYHRLGQQEIDAMLAERRSHMEGAKNPGLSTYQHKFSADFSTEMRRSVREMLKNWRE